MITTGTEREICWPDGNRGNTFVIAVMWRLYPEYLLGFNAVILSESRKTRARACLFSLILKYPFPFRLGFERVVSVLLKLQHCARRIPVVVEGCGYSISGDPEGDSDDVVYIFANCSKILPVVTKRAVAKINLDGRKQTSTK